MDKQTTGNVDQANLTCQSCQSLHGKPGYLLLSLLSGFILLASLYSVVNPLFEAPDEIWHYEYVRWLVEGRGLPRPEVLDSAPWRQEGSQPPLYYLLAAALTAAIPIDNAERVIRYNPHAAVGDADAAGNKNVLLHDAAQGWPWQGVTLAAHLVRVLSILLGGMTVFATYQMARLVTPGVAPAFVAALFVAASPQFLFLSAAISNDNLVTACAALTLWLLVTMVVQAGAPRVLQLVALGLLIGCAALSKVSGLALVAPAMFALTWLAWRRRAWRDLLFAGIGVGGVALAVASWWYFRNWQLYGDPLGLAAMFAVLPGRAEPLSLAQVAGLLPGIWRSYWAVFGWFNIVVADWVYWLYSALTLLGLLGLIVSVVRQPRRGWRSPVAFALFLLLVWIFMLALLVVRWSQISYPQGRLLFPAASALATLLALGLLGSIPAHGRPWLAGLLTAGLATLALIAPWYWLAPAYAAPPLLPVTSTLPNPAAIRFGDELVLRGYRWQPADLRPGGALDVELFWQGTRTMANDYSIFVHLVDENEILQAQHDSYPAAGALPTSAWPLDAVIRDLHQLTLPAVLPTPNRLRLEVGAYDYGSGRRLQTAGGESAALALLPLLPVAADEPQVIFVNFADKIALVNYHFDRWLVAAGESLRVDLQWQALAAPAIDYVVFVHLLLPPDAVWAQRDAMPQDGAQPTSSWAAGELVDDHYHLEIPVEAPPGLYTVEIGLYNPDTGERLPVGLSDAGVRLGQVRVTAAN